MKDMLKALLIAGLMFGSTANAQEVSGNTFNLEVYGEDTGADLSATESRIDINENGITANKKRLDNLNYHQEVTGSYAAGAHQFFDTDSFQLSIVGAGREGNDNYGYSAGFAKKFGTSFVGHVTWTPLSGSRDYFTVGGTYLF